MATKHHYLNPFILSPDIPDEYFCDRKAETETLLRYVMNGNNILLISPRRMGKSGIMHHVFNRHEVKDKYYSFFIDIYETSSLEEFVQKLTHGGINCVYGILNILFCGYDFLAGFAYTVVFPVCFDKLCRGREIIIHQFPYP